MLRFFLSSHSFGALANPSQDGGSVDRTAPSAFYYNCQSSINQPSSTCVTHSGSNSIDG